MVTIRLHFGEANMSQSTSTRIILNEENCWNGKQKCPSTFVCWDSFINWDSENFNSIQNLSPVAYLLDQSIVLLPSQRHVRCHWKRDSRCFYYVCLLLTLAWLIVAAELVKINADPKYISFYLLCSTQKWSDSRTLWGSWICFSKQHYDSPYLAVMISCLYILQLEENKEMNNP